jgi:hypothetical protein
MSPPPFSPLFVVGMHRSGTSAVAGLLASLGVSPARWCAESRSNTANPRGFFEPRPLVWENERLLNWLDASWACPPGRVDELDLSPLLLSEGARSARVFMRSRRSHGAWFWKDPRLSLLLGYWEQVATHASSVPAASTGVVYVVRNPAAVATSLQQRDGLDQRHANDLWRIYNHSALKLCRGRPVYVIDYDRLIAHPDEERSALAEWLRTIGVRTLLRPDEKAVDEALRRSEPSPASMSHEREMYAELLAQHGPHSALPDVDLPVDRQILLRLASRRDQSRQAWERNNRIDRRLRRTTRRTASIVPAAAREVLNEWQR